MKLLRGLHSYVELAQGAVASIGNFDGVHLGHQQLIKSLQLKAQSMNLPSVIILFEPQPREYFQKDKAPPRLTSLREKLNLFRQFNVDYVFCIKFDELLASMDATDFAMKYLFKHLNIKFLMVGHDFKFGKNREGDIHLLHKLGTASGCHVDVFPEFMIANERVSSTKIRHALDEGNLKLAEEYLGRTYSVCGRVIHGAGRGREWGIPTANINMQRILLPLQGVFVVEVMIDNQIHQGVANIGKRPTVDGTKNVLEIHVLNFNQSIYGKLVQVFFLHKLRNEVKFVSIDQLIQQINQDIKATQQYFALNTKSNKL